MTYCPFDGSLLDSSGFCSAGEGFPITSPCRIACPICRHFLDYSGACFSCHGVTDIRADWQLPGDRYEIDFPDGTPRGNGKHWVLVLTGSRPAGFSAR